MQCPFCGATCAPGATSACDVCGRPFDLDVTGAIPAAVVQRAPADETRLEIDAGPTAAPVGTGAGVPAKIASADETRLAIDAGPTAAPVGTSAGVPAKIPRPAASGARTTLEVGGGFGGRYHIIRLLGMGGMGAVYHAWDSELEVALALKVIRPDFAADPEAAAEIERRFKRELLLARQVTHPNVVRIHDLGEVDGVKYITMPYVQGKDLAAILEERGKLPVPEALKLALQIAAGLLAAHHAGVVHRDLKPANILIDAGGHALITDFGIARATGVAETTSSLPRAVSPAGLTAGATRVGTIMGSIEYMAPEQARAEQVDHRADIYAFGLILYRMLAGPRPNDGLDPIARLQARMTAEPTHLREVDPEVPEALDQIVSRCLQPDPAARFKTTQELVDALDRLDENGHPLPLPVQLLKSARFWIAAAAAAITIAAGTWILTGRPPPRTPDPVAVLVADFVNRTGEPVFDGLLEQSLTVGIEGASFITAVPHATAVKTAKLIKAGDRLDESAARLVALREGVKVVLLGGIDKRGSGYRLSVQGVDPSSRKVLFSSTADARDRDAVLKVSAGLAAKVRTSLGDTRTIDPRETLSTGSLEAVNAYTKAQELSAAGKDQEAIEFFRKAVSLDPGFGRAYGGLAMSTTRLGRREEAAGLWKEALNHLDVMGEREKYRLLGAYYFSVTRNYEAARDNYEKLVSQYPADGAGHNNLAVASFQTMQFNKAMDEGRRATQMYPNNALYRANLALYAMYAGNFTLASQEAGKLVKDGLATYDTYLPLAVSAIAEGKLKEAGEFYTQMAAVDESGVSLAAIGRADLALAQGQAADAESILQTGIATDREHQNPAGIAGKEIALADALGMQGNLKGAVAAVRRALAIDTTESQIVPAARWLIAANQLAEAERLGQTLDRRIEKPSRAYGKMIAAQVARARGRPVDAVDALREALKFSDLWLVRFTLGQAYLDAGAPTEALSEFETCLKRRGEGYAVFLDDVPSARAVAPIRYWIARAHEGMGLLPQAATDYQAFTAEYDSGSPEPLLKDANKRIAALR